MILIKESLDDYFDDYFRAMSPNDIGKVFPWQH